MSKSKKKNKKVRHEVMPQHPAMTPEDAYEYCDALDLPDGAFWAMVEELSGATPDEFVE